MAQPPLTFFCELPEASLAALLATPGLVAQLRELRASVSMACLDRSAARARAIRAFLDGGVPVTAWVVLPRDQGYFAHADNAPAVAAECDALVDWLRRERLAVTTLGIDVEMEIERMEELAQAPWRLTVPAIRGALDPARTEAAEVDYERLIARLHARGLRVETYQLPPVVDGRAARSSLMARAFGMMELGADREVLMLYSSALPAGAAWVESYAADAGAIGLGVTGGGTVVVPQMSWDDLARDLGVAARAGKPIYLFSLEGCVERGWLERLAGFDWPAPARPALTPRRLLLDGLRAALRAGLLLDAALLGALRALRPDRTRRARLR